MSDFMIQQGVYLQIDPEDKYSVTEEEFDLVGDFMKFCLDSEILPSIKVCGRGHWYGFIHEEDWPKVKAWLEERFEEKIDE